MIVFGSWVCEFDQQQNAELLFNPFIHSSHKDVWHWASATGQMVPGMGTQIWQASEGNRRLKQTIAQQCTNAVTQAGSRSREVANRDTGVGYTLSRMHTLDLELCVCGGGGPTFTSFYSLAWYFWTMDTPLKECQELQSFSFGLEKCTTLISLTVSWSLLQTLV